MNGRRGIWLSLKAKSAALNFRAADFVIAWLDHYVR
jgi:hypothetical protein